ncbi:hypothetical protein [Brevibacillus choshinensis]|uniref:hypothetical protein n=1 Tax=Brevibacillus choshinensis TaxID=54911 RepID=UPI002E1D342A|nr:hypothetical protein [Brevibacillus choshinensis]MED4755083.1 hypothetical protein [Brevibacillus choshinensis]MED4779638.1 hypothetical protein [Brevibacillus choshinensis]
MAIVLFPASPLEYVVVLFAAGRYISYRKWWNELDRVEIHEIGRMNAFLKRPNPL